jgi:hypothetical protein
MAPTLFTPASEISWLVPIRSMVGRPESSATEEGSRGSAEGAGPGPENCPCRRRHRNHREPMLVGFILSRQSVQVSFS